MGGASPFTMFPESTVAAEGDSIHRSLVKITSELHDAAVALGVDGTTTIGVSPSARQGQLYQYWNQQLLTLNTSLGLT